MGMKGEPTVMRIREWIGIAANGEGFLAEGNANRDFPVQLHLTTFDFLLSAGQMLRVGNRATMKYYCDMWNKALKEMRFDGYERMLVRPASAEFTLTVRPDGRKRR